MQPEEIAARVWPGRELGLEPLGGGITNRNFKVTVDGESFVLRIGGKDTELLGIDRDAEHAATLAAAELGIAPEVVAFLEPEGYLVTRFVEGSVLPPEVMRRPETLRRVAVILRRIHDGAPFPTRFDSFRVVEAYLAIARERGVAEPVGYRSAKQTADAIESARGDQQDHPCHNDLLNANFIAADGDIRIVDWEYAGMGDRFFDLANFSINHELGDEENEQLLAAYFGELDETQLAALRLMRFMSDFREAMWGVVQQGLSELDFDFVGYADEHFARLEHTAADPAFREALQTIQAQLSQ
jgi:thiamine kinase-like enzyme